ncbi:class I SAM-dependent methyltransferase [bacterium]|nr:class I SAM-dependent methyltransferase [bacterium]
MAPTDWSKIHQEDKSWRQQIQGDAISDYVVERYIQLFEEAFNGSPRLSFLEVGSGTGDISRRIVNSKYPFVSRYVVSESFQKGVDWLAEKGLEAKLIDAQSIDLPDESFDVVISFDVMHHVDKPAAMAREMARVSKGRVLLTEANGLSLGRKLMELTAGHRAAGERSYLPMNYIRFFSSIDSIRITKLVKYPFLFVFKTPDCFSGSVILLSRILEKIPFFKWQCATVCLDLTFERKGNK